MALFLPALAGCARESIRWDDVQQLRAELRPTLENFESRRQSLQGSLSQLIYNILEWSELSENEDWESLAPTAPSDFLQVLQVNSSQRFGPHGGLADELLAPLELAMDRIIELEAKEKIDFEPIQQQLLNIDNLERYQVKSVLEALVALEIKVLDSILWVSRYGTVLRRYRRRLLAVADIDALLRQRIECEKSLRIYQSRGELLEADEALLQTLREAFSRRQSTIRECIDFLEAIDFDIFRPVRIGRYIQEPIGVAGG